MKTKKEYKIEFTLLKREVNEMKKKIQIELTFKKE